MDYLEIERRQNPDRISVRGDKIKTNQADAIKLLEETLAALKKEDAASETYQNEIVLKK